MKRNAETTLVATTPHRQVVLTVPKRQRSRPQLFSNALPPTVAASALAAVEFIECHPERVQQLHDNTRFFPEHLIEAGVRPLPGETPIVPIIIGDTADAIRMSDMMLDEGVFVTGFGFPPFRRERRDTVRPLNALWISGRVARIRELLHDYQEAGREIWTFVRLSKRWRLTWRHQIPIVRHRVDSTLG